MDDRDIKRANRKALPVFLLIVATGAVVGGVVGYFSARYGLNELSGGIRSAGAWFGANAAPWLLVAMAVIVPAVSVPLYRGAKKLLAGWDGEDEAVSDAVDEKLSKAIWLVGAGLIVSYFLLAAAYSGGFGSFDSKRGTVLVFVSIAAFLAVMIEAIVLQQKCVDATKRTNPEKTASVYDMKFHKKWMDSCDEAEKVLAGKCAIKAYAATNGACSALAVILAVCALVFETGFLPSLAVCLIWIVNQSVYCKEALKYSKAGNRIS